MKNKRYSRDEELSNTLSHGAGILLGITAGYFLWKGARQPLTPIGQQAVYWLIWWGCWHHTSVRPGITAPGPAKRKELLRKFDHGAIYLHIAGTYTPFTPVSATPCRRMGLGNLHFCMAVGYCRIHISLQKLERTQQSRDDLFCRDGLCHPGGPSNH